MFVLKQSGKGKQPGDHECFQCQLRVHKNGRLTGGQPTQTYFQAIKFLALSKLPSECSAFNLSFRKGGADRAPPGKSAARLCSSVHRRGISMPPDLPRKRIYEAPTWPAG
jgi:hypothetical protein